MRAIKFKCIYNTVLGSHESKCVLKWMTTSCSRNQMWQALDPKRRWPLSPVSASRALTVCELSGTLGRPGCFEFDSSKYCPLSLDDSAQRWLGASACQYFSLSWHWKNYRSYQSIPALQVVRPVSKVSSHFGADDNHHCILSRGFWIFSTLESTFFSYKWNLFYMLLSGR